MEAGLLSTPSGSQENPLATTADRIRAEGHRGNMRRQSRGSTTTQRQGQHREDNRRSRDHVGRRRPACFGGRGRAARRA